MEFKISNSYLSFKTSSDTDIIDITPYVSRKVEEAGLMEGQASQPPFHPLEELPEPLPTGRWSVPLRDGSAIL